MTLRVTFLGTSGAVPTTGRNPSAIHVNRDGDCVLLDAGEGTQRQMMRFGTGFGIDRVLLTHVHADHVLGLPGLVLTMDFNDRTRPLTVSTPPGTAENVRNLLLALDDRPSFQVHIEEVDPGSVLHSTEEYRIETFRTDHRTQSVGYALIEADRPGRFDRERAESLGVPPGPLFGQLHSGEAVELEDGTVVDPAQVVGPPRPGRTLVYTGDTRPTDRTAAVAAGADLLIHDATFADDRADRADETGHSTARAAGRLADRASVRRLALTHISSRYAGEAGTLKREAAEAFDGEVVLAEDGRRLDIPLPD